MTHDFKHFLGEVVKALQLQPEIPLSNPTRHLPGLIDPTSLQGSW